MKQTKCKQCGYEWTARVSNPKACPRCKNRLDYPFYTPMGRSNLVATQELNAQGGNRR